MYKWHVHSAIGRGRPVGPDVSRVTDGIVSFLRQFSISLSRSADGDDSPRTSRSQRSKEAFSEILSTPAAQQRAIPRTRGVDARNLGAPRPPGAFTITRVEVDAPVTRSSGHSPQAAGTSSRTPRPAGRAGGRTGGGRGGKGRGRAAKRVRGPRNKEDDMDDGAGRPLTEEELAYRDGSEQGFLRPYNPTTSEEALARRGPPVISSPRGVIESLRYKLTVGTGTDHTGTWEIGGDHLNRVAHGSGSMFETLEEREITQAHNQKIGKERAKAYGIPYEPSVMELGSLSAQSKDKILKEWVGGQYVFPRPAETTDTLGLVAGYARRNETYLPEDTRKFEEKLRSLLPTS